MRAHSFASRDSSRSAASFLVSFEAPRAEKGGDKVVTDGEGDMEDLGEKSLVGWEEESKGRRSTERRQFERTSLNSGIRDAFQAQRVPKMRKPGKD